MIERLKFYKNFPKEGINFVDIIPFLQSKEAFNEIMTELNKHISCATVAAPEARAFLFAAPLLSMDESLVTNVIPIRKSGKLPFSEGDLVDVRIQKEYGFDTLFYRPSDVSVSNEENGVIYITIVDDVLATGGTAEGLAQSLENQVIVKDGKECKIKIKEFVFLVGIPEIGGRERLEKIAPVYTLMDI